MDTKINVVNLTEKKVNYTNKKSGSNKLKSMRNFFDKLLQGNVKKDINCDNKNRLIDNQNLKENVDNCNNVNKKEIKGNNKLKLLNNKYVKSIIVVLIFGILALIILNSSFSTSHTSSKDSSNSNSYMSSLEYCEKLENKLVGVLSGISGAGNVKVMITVEHGPELKLASNTDERTNITTNGNGSTTNTTKSTEPIIVRSASNSQPLILSEVSPKITGVVVVASGAKDVRVKLNLLEAVKALLDVSSNNIQIYY